MPFGPPGIHALAEILRMDEHPEPRPTLGSGDELGVPGRSYSTLSVPSMPASRWPGTEQ